MLFLLAVVELMSVVEGDASPDEVTVNCLHVGNYSKPQYWDISCIYYWVFSLLASQSVSLNMLPLVLTSSMIASNSSSLEQIGWQRTLPARSCNHRLVSQQTLDVPHLMPRHPVGEQLIVCRYVHLGRLLGVSAVSSYCCPHSDLISRTEHWTISSSS